MIKIKRKRLKKKNKLLKFDTNLQQAENICNVGHVLQEKGQLDEAMAYYQKALQLKPNYAVAIYNLGSAFHKKGQLEEAIACYKKVLKLDSNAFAYNNLGAALQEKGRLGEALICYEKAIRLNPKYATASCNL
jgi:protein O-GlcNAc transferase